MFSRIRERLECLILPKGRVLVFFRVKGIHSAWAAVPPVC
jgi:hypothetical protein